MTVQIFAAVNTGHMRRPAHFSRSGATSVAPVRALPDNGLDLASAERRASAATALCVAPPGAVIASPSQADIEAFLSETP